MIDSYTLGLECNCEEKSDTFWAGPDWAAPYIIWSIFGSIRSRIQLSKPESYNPPINPSLKLSSRISMRQFLQRFPSLFARNFLHSPSNFRQSIPNYRLVPSLDRNRTISRFAFFSSQSDSARGPISDEVVSKEGDISGNQLSLFWFPVKLSYPAEMGLFL